MMEKFSFRVLLLGLAMLFPLPGQGQAADTAKVFPGVYAFGLKGGADYFRVHFAPSVRQSLTRGYSAGLAFKYLSLPRAGLQVELNYIQRGWTAAADSGSRQWQYLELPLLTHVVLGRRRSAFLLNFGPWVSYLLSARDSLTWVTETPNPQSDFGNVPRPWLYGLSLGLGYSLGMPRGRLQLEGRLSYSLVNALKGDSFAASRYQVLGLSLGYFIEF